MFLTREQRYKAERGMNVDVEHVTRRKRGSSNRSRHRWQGGVLFYSINTNLGVFLATKVISFCLDKLLHYQNFHDYINYYYYCDYLKNVVTTTRYGLFCYCFTPRAIFKLRYFFQKQFEVVPDLEITSASMWSASSSSNNCVSCYHSRPISSRPE